MLLPHGVVIALVDGQKFELFRNIGNEAEPELEALPSPDLDLHNMGSGGRHFSSAGNPQRSLQEEDAHAAGVAQWLNQEVLAHRIDKLVIIAAPRTLGELRRHYHKQLEAALAGDFAKDLAGRSGPEIIAALRGK